MKTSKNLIGVGMGFALLGGMGVDAEDTRIAYTLVVIGLILMGAGIKKLKPFLMVMAISVLTVFPTMEVNAQSNKDVLTDEIVQYCDAIGERYCVCSELLQSIIIQESMGKHDAENNGCVGLMQINERFHKERMERLAVTDLTDEFSNILVGADYLMELASKYGDVGLTLAIYHGESDAIENDRNGIVSNYAKEILERSEFLEREHGK